MRTSSNRTPATLIMEANRLLLVDGDIDAVEVYFAPHYVVHLTGREMKGGHEMIRENIRMLRRSFSSLQIAVEVLVESPNRVAWQRTFRGVHEQLFRGFPGSGQPLVWRDLVVSNFTDGLISEEWLVTDLAEHLLAARKR